MKRGMHKSNPDVSPAEMQKYLHGANYPTNKNELLNIARDNGAPNEVVSMIEHIPRNEFGGPQDVMKGYEEETQNEE